MKWANLLGPRDMRHLKAQAILDDFRPAVAAQVMVFAGMEPDALVFGSRRRPFVACTTGLLDLLDRDEIKGVFAHEVVHALKGHTRKAKWPRVCKWKLVKVAAAFRSRHLEYVVDADIVKLGADPRALRSALVKIGNDLGDLSVWQFLTTGTHPRNSRRVRMLDQHIRQMTLDTGGRDQSRRRRVSARDGLRTSRSVQPRSREPQTRRGL